MTSKRLSVGILLVVLASRTSTLGMAAELAPVQQGNCETTITDAEDDCFDECFRPTWNVPCPCVYVQVQALLLQPVYQFSQQPIVVDPNTNTTFLSTSNLNSNFNPGLQATVGTTLRNGRAVEFDYFGLYGGGASAVAVKPDPAAFLTFPNNLAGNAFVDMDTARVNYTSALNSFAVNLPCCCGCCNECCCGAVSSRSVTWFTGFRYLNLNQHLNIASQRTVAGVVEDGNYNVRTNNNLYGAQLGARVRRTSGQYGWDATGFGGIFGNSAQQTQSVTDFPNFPLRPTASSSRGGVAFVGGGNVSGLYGLSNAWNLRAGYTVLWIDGVALAPDQLNFNFAAPASGQLHNGGMFLHGVTVGMDGRW